MNQLSFLPAIYMMKLIDAADLFSKFWVTSISYSELDAE